VSVLDGEVHDFSKDYSAVLADCYCHVVDRIIPFARFATRYMSKQTAPHYIRHMQHIKKVLESEAESNNSIILIVGHIKRAMLEYPMTKVRVRDTFNGEMSSEVEARKLAMEHAYDLALSYRRFDGLVPMGNLENFLKYYVRDALVSNLKTLANIK
jgi:hypothetical protein